MKRPSGFYNSWKTNIKLATRKDKVCHIQPNNFQLLSLRYVYCHVKAESHWKLSNLKGKSDGLIGILRMKQLTPEKFPEIIVASSTWDIILFMVSLVPLHSFGSRLQSNMIGAPSFCKILCGAVNVGSRLLRNSVGWLIIWSLELILLTYRLFPLQVTYSEVLHKFLLQRYLLVLKVLDHRAICY